MTNWRGAVERTVTGLGYDLVDVQKSVGGVLRVYIDLLPPDSGASVSDAAITVDDCEKVTRQLQHVLEVEGCSYERLEVSSPGLDRPLNKPADFDRFAGQQVEIALKQPFKGRKKFSGLLQREGAGWRLLLDAPRPVRATRRAALAAIASGAESDQALDFSLDEVREAHLVPVVDFKGRRFASPVVAPGTRLPDERQDGGGIQ